MKNANIAKVLKEYRKQHQFSVRDVSIFLKKRKIDVAEKTIYGWESGQTQPDADTLLTLCEIYEIKDILGSFGYDETNQDLFLTSEEKNLILKYRKRPDMHSAIYKLLQ